jgi:condensin complex subunit 1
MDCLEDHVHDVNAFVRSSVLQTWGKLCQNKAIPLSRYQRLLQLVVGRLKDKSSNVRKQVC